MHRSKLYKERKEIEKINSTRKRGINKVFGILGAGRKLSEIKAGRKNFLLYLIERCRGSK